MTQGDTLLFHKRYLHTLTCCDCSYIRVGQEKTHESMHIRSQIHLCVHTWTINYRGTENNLTHFNLNLF